MENADSGAFDAAASLLEENGYRRMEAYAQGGYRFAAYFDGERGMFLNEYAAIGRLSIVEEENSRYFAYTDVCAKASVPAQITQIALEDFGMSYVIRLTDGRFIVFDGGREFEPDRERLHRCLSDGAMGKKPVIAAWILTQVCFLPVSEHNAFTIFCIYREGTRYLMSKAGIGELITGSVQRTITLPYMPPEYAKWELEQRYLTGLDNAGSCTWMFSGLHTYREEDFRFTILNTVNFTATVWIELFFEDAARKVRFIKAQVPAGSLRQVNIVGEDVDADALYFNWLSLKAQGVPENAPFAVRFMSDVPVVVSHPEHPASYHAAGNRILRTF